MRVIAFPIALCAATTAAANPIDTIRPDAPELAAYGPHAVGVTTRTFTDPGRIDILAVEGDARPTYDRELTVEIWYPAAEGTEPGGTYEDVPLRDPSRTADLTGIAVRDAEPAAEGSFPLVVISHGYPGNRFLMAHLGENLASKGYVTASIGHTDSTYSDQAAFGSTLYNRPLDQRFVIESMAALDGPIGALVDAENTGVIGYSMGGYGALILGGAGVTQTSVDYEWGTPAGLLGRHLAGSETHEALPDPRVKALIAIGPWGRNRDFWDAEGLSGIETPLLIMAGGVDDVSDYGAMRSIFEEATGTTRHLLTFEHANHNAAAPMPAPAESYAPSETLGFPPFEHYADAVWDNVRMNNIAQHFATAFMDLHLKGEADRAAYLDLVEVSGEGVVDLGEDGSFGPAHSYWEGFAPRTAAGLRLETLPE
jgi:predicted dienelactone hydrolase